MKLEMLHLVGKNLTTFTKLIGVSKEGTIWFISRSYPDSNNDINLANFS